jgi:hypothetical protein
VIPLAYDKEMLHRTKATLGHLMKLIEDGVLVRNVENDGDYIKYMRQSTELVLVLRQAAEVLK